jgi:hypothetical protein
MEGQSVVAPDIRWTPRNHGTRFQVDLTTMAHEANDLNPGNWHGPAPVAKASLRRMSRTPPSRRFAIAVFLVRTLPITPDAVPSAAERAESTAAAGLGSRKPPAVSPSLRR